MTNEEYDHMSESQKKKEDWMNSKWRPAMGWVYMVTCITDFIVFPVLWSWLQVVTENPVTPWQPLTLQGAGFFHIAMGAIIGVAVYGRTQEKLAGANVGGAPGAAAVAAPTAVAAAPAPTTGSGRMLAPVQPEHPVL